VRARLLLRARQTERLRHLDWSLDPTKSRLYADEADQRAARHLRLNNTLLPSLATEIIVPVETGVWPRDSADAKTDDSRKISEAADGTLDGATVCYHELWWPRFTAIESRDWKMRRKVSVRTRVCHSSYSWAEGGPACNQMSPHFDSWSL